MRKGDEKKLFYSGVRGQIWIETVVYTLIAITLIGAVLAFILPRIEEIQDNAVIEQSVGVLEDLNSVILEVVHGGRGNKRIMDIGVKKGELKIRGAQDLISFEIESGYGYSELDKSIKVGNVDVITQRVGSELNRITLSVSYDEYDLAYAGEDAEKIIGKSPAPYKLSIENKGEVEGKIVVDMEVI